MPHLPPPTVFGGSVKVKIPVSKVKAGYKKSGEPLFKKERVVEAFPPGSKKKYAFDLYSATDDKAKIYKIEIRGADKNEVFEFRPKNGKCTIAIYYAISSELPLKHSSKWLEPGEELCSDDPHEHEHAHD